MSITLDTFRAAIESKTDTGFVEFSARKHKVDTYGTNFFARHFGWYSKRDADTNREVRQQFFNALSETGRCQENVLAEIKSRLGLEAGNAVKDRPLSIREIRTMMAWADNSTRAVTFNRPASQEYTNSLLSQFRDSMQQSLTLPENTPDNELWEQTANDANRLGLSLNINGNQICTVMDYKSFDNDNLNQTVNDIVKALNAQTLNDKTANRILSNILHQGIGGIFNTALFATGNTMQEIGSCQLITNQFSSFTANVQRQDDGSYDLNLGTTMNFLTRLKENGEQEYFTSNSQMLFNVKLKLSFNENGIPQLDLLNQEPPTLKGTFEKCNFNMDEIQLLSEAVGTSQLDSQTALTNLMNAPTLLQNPELRTKVDNLKELKRKINANPQNQNLKTRRQEAMADLRNFMKPYLITQNDRRKLENMGIDNSIFALLSGNWGGTGRIDRKLINQLTGQNELEFAKGIATLQKMCHEIHTLGITSKEIIVTPLNKALVDIGGFSLNGLLFKNSDAGLLVNYTRQHPEEHLLEDLNAGDQNKVNNAKDRLKNILADERKKVGLGILKNQYNFKQENLNVLETKLGKDTLNSMMEHIYKQDAEMESTLNTLRQLVKTN